MDSLDPIQNRILRAWSEALLYQIGKKVKASDNSKQFYYDITSSTSHSVGVFIDIF